jgi:O-antigen biosynthesis protein
LIRRLFAWLRRRAKRPERRPNKTVWSWLSSELLLVGGLPVADHWSLTLRRGGATTPLEARNVRYEHTERGQSSVLLVRLPGETTAGASLALDGGRGRRAEISQVELHEGAVELPVLVERALTGGVRRSREALEAALVADSLDLLEHREGFSLAGRLKVLRDVLNEPLGERVIDAQVPQTVFVDTIMAVDDRSFWIAGWVRDADRSATSLLAVSPEGQRAELLEGGYRHPRPDVEELFAGESRQETDHGFVKYVTLPAPSPLDHGWIVELRTRVGPGVEVPGPEVVRDRTEVLDRILSEFDLDRTDRDRLRLEHVMPALERFQEHGRHAVAVEEVRDFGVVPRRPEVSVVVPLYGRIDFVEHQLAQFGGDPQFRDVELVYVLDSPELGPDLLRVAPHLHALHQVPFRLVRLSRNAGFSLANNLGVGESRAPLVLLLNSDVLPTEPGWLGRMAAFYDSTQDIGALGAKLLFEDDSIQHAGMYFQRDIESQVWGNRHYFKGFHRDFAEGRISRPVPAVTGACLMISRELYAAHGGLNTAYVRGGYEDSDLCIRLAEYGKRNWYLADVELYHLEAQSYPSPVRRLATLYNAWLQTHLWDAEIESLARAHAESADRALVASAGLSDSAG